MLLLFVLLNEEICSNDFVFGILNLVSLILIYDMNGEIVGFDVFVLDYFFVVLLFFGFCVMVGVGVLMLLVSWFGVWCVWCNKLLFKFYMYVLIGMIFLGWVVMIVGWYVMEIGC